MPNSPFFPTLRLGDKVEFSNDPQAPESRWRLGEVTALKTDSCDLVVYQLEGLDFRHDCIHIDDPRCYKTRDWATTGRGIFRLALVEVERRAREDRMDAIERRMTTLENLVRCQTAEDDKASPKWRNQKS
jgi:hypothetical protein